MTIHALPVDDPAAAELAPPIDPAALAEANINPTTGLARGALSLKDLVLIAGGLFLLAKSSNDIHDNLEDGGQPQVNGSGAALSAVLLQMFLLNTVFSIDSVLTAIGMVDHVEVMIAAIVVATGLMFVYAKFVAQFVRSHPSTKMLALAFIVLISVNLIAEGFHYDIPKGYTYFSMAFSVAVELLNRKARSKRRQVPAVRAEPQPMP